MVIQLSTLKKRIKMKKYLLAFCFCLATYSLYSQSVFTYDLKKDIIIGGLSLGVFASPFFVENTPPQIPDSLNKNDINGFDRSLMFSYNKSLDIISDYGVYGMLVLPIVSVIGNGNDINAWLTYGIMYTEAFFLTFGTKDLLKNAIIKYRPYMYEGGIPAGQENDYYNSFPSGSTSLAFLSATFLSTTFLQEHPDSKWKLPVIIGSYSLATTVSAMRITSGAHFITDVLAGAAIGSFYGWIIPFLHKNNSTNNIAVNVAPNGFFVKLKI
jgi:membrane-associated phospholipid phosphatase